MASDGPPEARIRVDKWLWFARFFRTRGLAAETAGSGRLRINGERCAKPAQGVQAGDVLTFPQAGRVRVIRILATGARRGPAPEALALYADLAPDSAPDTAAEASPGHEEPPAAIAAPAPAPPARPDRRDRRSIGRLRRREP